MTGSFRRRSYRILLLGAILVLSASNVHRCAQESTRAGWPQGDFIEYWAAGRLFWAGENPYDPGQMDSLERAAGWTGSSPLMMWNPPWTIPVVLPYALLPFWTARALWLWTHLILLVGAADRLWRYCEGPLSGRWISWVAALLFFPAALALYLGQISPLLLVGMCGFLVALRKGRDFAAGGFAALLALKPQALYLFWIFLLWWIIRERRWKVAAGLALWLTASSLIVWSASPGIFHSYLAAVSSGNGPAVWQTPTWGVALRMIGGSSLGEWVRFAPMTAGLAIALWWWGRNRTRFSWGDHLMFVVFLVLLPAAVLILVRFHSRPRIHAWPFAGMLAVEVLMVSQSIFGGNYFYSIWVPPSLALVYSMSNVRRRRGIRATALCSGSISE
jgi:hypothetical protein